MTMSSRLVAASLAALLGACSSVSLIQADNEWASTYAKLQARERTGTYVTANADYEAQLADLSQRAASAGDDAADPRVAIGFYRVAVLSAWKSDSRRLSEQPSADAPINTLLPLVAKGKAACDRLERKKDSQPRDCYLFDFVPYFALADAAELDRRALESTDVRDPVVLATYRKTLNGLRQAAHGIATYRPEAVAAVTVKKTLPATALGYIDCNWMQIVQNANSVKGPLLRTLGQDAAAPIIQGVVEPMQTDFDKAKIDVRRCAAP